MSEQTFDDVTRRAGEVVSRRASLMTLGGATLAAVAAKPAITEAKKNKANKKAKKKAKKKCQKQVGQCESFVTRQCARFMDRAGCEARSLPCCNQFSSCNAGAALNCLATIS